MDRYERELLDWLTDGGGAKQLASVSRDLRSAPWNHHSVQWLNEVDELIAVCTLAHAKRLKSYLDLLHYLYPDGRMQSAYWVYRNRDAHFDVELVESVPSGGRLQEHQIDWHPFFDIPSKEAIEKALEKALKFLDAGDLDGGDEWARSLPHGGFYTVQALLFKTIFGVREQIEARNHSEACWRLDATRAGLKARDLLMGILDDKQVDTLIKYGYFDVIKVHPLDYRLLPQSQWRYFRPIRGRDQRYFLRTRRYRIYPAWPNGNVVMVDHLDRGVANFCLHPPQAFPDDDIAVAQKLLIESDELQFWNDANVTPHPRDWSLDEIATHRYTDRNEFLRTLDRKGDRPKVYRTIAEARSHAIAQAT